MPIYEYQCQDCRRVSGFLILNLNESFTPVCPKCGSSALVRVLSRVHVRLSEETRLERLADPSAWSGVDENDPKSMARMLKKMTQEMGEESGDEVDQMVEEAMAEGAGQSEEDSF
ncbi:MAG: zinc ribbon domain-containing protein [Deltaproteobacteria bacterium]|nr:zinc ribbon domain-containing protein [Deltaproteobacteria bacterium]